MAHGAWGLRYLTRNKKRSALPSLEIRQGAIDTLCDLYKSLLVPMGGYICDGGDVNVLDKSVARTEAREFHCSRITL